MTSFTPREVRQWALRNDVPCPTTGRIPKTAIDAYLLAVHGVTAEPEPEPTTEESTIGTVEMDTSDFGLVVNIPDAQDEDVETIANLLLEVVVACYRAGRAHERATMLAALGVQS